MKNKMFATLFIAASAFAQNPGGWPREQAPQTTPQEPTLSQRPGNPQGPVDGFGRPNSLPEPMPTGQRPYPTQMAATPAPHQLTAPAGTWVLVRMDQFLSSEFNHQGDVFMATLAQPIIADGFVVARRGQTLSGRVTEAVKAGRVKGTSRLGVEIFELGVVDGQNAPVKTQFVTYNGGTSNGRDAAAIGTTTGLGAAIGAAANGGVGAGVGAGAGLIVSTIGVLATKGHPTEIHPEMVMRFRLTEAVTVSTERAPQAFQPVQQYDYESRPALQQRPMMPQQRPYNSYGPAYPGYYPYSYWGPSYWGPSFYFSSGPRFYGGRGYYGRR